MGITKEDRLNELFEELVPNSGCANNIAGEIVRAVCHIGYRFYSEGDKIGVGSGCKTCNPAAKFLKNHNDMFTSIINEMVTYDTRKYQHYLQKLINYTVDYIDDNKHLREQSTEDMYSFDKINDSLLDHFDEEDYNDE